MHALPLSCVSIGLCVGGAPTLGVVYDPYRDELFVGVAADAEGSEGGAGGAGGAGGEGVGGAWAYLNGERIRADGACLRLDKAVVCTDLGYERSAAGVERISNAQAALLRANVFALRTLGSTVRSPTPTPTPKPNPTPPYPYPNP